MRIDPPVATVRGSPVTILQFEAATRTFGVGRTAVTALRAVDLRLQRGELLVVMGPSGSGKSTLLHLAGGLDTPSDGVVSVHGRATSAMSARERAAMRRRTVGYVFQQYNLLPQLTALENVSLPLELDGMKAAVAGRAAAEMLGALGLSAVEQQFPDTLSGGEQQRVAIGRALVGDRSILLADEPTGALDSDTAAVVMRSIRERCNGGAAAIVVTHNPLHARYGDRTIHLRDGEVAADSGLLVTR